MENDKSRNLWILRYRRRSYLPVCIRGRRDHHGVFCESWNRLSLFTRIMIGFAVGIILGLVMGPKAAIFAPLGTILTKLLTMVVAPLVFTLLVCAAADVGDGKRLGRIGIKTVIIFLLSTAVAIVLGLVVSNVMNIGSGVSLVGISTADQPKQWRTYLSSIRCSILFQRIFSKH